MRLIGYSREQAERPQLEKLWNIVESEFPGTFHFAIEAEETMSDAKSFDLSRAAELLREHSFVSFFERDVVGVSLDVQSYKNPRMIYPHSLFEIEWIDTARKGHRTGLEWMALAEKITEECGLELAMVLGPAESAGDYLYPLGIGLGLIKPYWVMAFGKGYSEIIFPRSKQPSFFRRERFGAEGLQAFLATETYEEYLRQPKDRIQLQKQEIGIDLFHRRPVEGKKKEEPAVSWVFSPRNIVRFALAVAANSRANARKYQAKIVPGYYTDARS
jgi:hypothetical protein